MNATASTTEGTSRPGGRLVPRFPTHNPEPSARLGSHEAAMDDLLSQRWTERRESWVAPALPFQPSRFEVAPLDEAGARAFVQAHHYSGTYPAARFRFGLYEGHDLVGAAVFSVPVNDKALSMFPGEPVESVELGRLVLLDRVPANAESWFIARAFDGLRRERLLGVLSFSDPMPRHADDGTVLTPGHVGIVYQATNARYLGRATPRTLHFLRDGRVFSARAMQKIRAGERGWRAAAEVLREAGAPALDEGTDRTEWLRLALATVATTRRHPGNHRYVWGLDRRTTKHLPSSQPYPCPVAGRAAPKYGRRALAA